MKSAITATLAVLAVGGGILDWRLWERADRAAAVRMEAESDLYRSRIAQEEKTVGELERQARLLSTAARPAADSDLGPVPSPGVGSARGPEAEALDQKAYRLEWVADLSAKYGPLFKQLGLNETAVEEFQGILFRQREDVEDLLKTLQAHPTTRLRITDIVAEAKTLLAPHDQEIIQLIGQDGFEQYQRFQETMAERNTVEALDRALGAEGLSIDPGQKEALTDTLYQNTQGDQRLVDYFFGMLAAPYGQVSTPLNDADADAAKLILTPDQLAVFQKFKADADQGARLRRMFYAKSAPKKG